MLRGVVVITTAQVHLSKPELRFYADSNPAYGVLEIRDGKDLWQWSRLEIKLNAFRRSTIPQKQFSSVQYIPIFAFMHIFFLSQPFILDYLYDYRRLFFEGPKLEYGQ